MKKNDSFVPYFMALRIAEALNALLHYNFSTFKQDMPLSYLLCYNGRIYILQYEVDGKYTLNISFISRDTPCGYSGDELLDMMQPRA